MVHSDYVSRIKIAWVALSITSWLTWKHEVLTRLMHRSIISRMSVSLLQRLNNTELGAMQVIYTAHFLRGLALADGTCTVLFGNETL